MMRSILTRELLEFKRDRRAIVIVLLMLSLLMAASLDGWNRAAADRLARQDAVATDKTVWVEQGENNPHGAAHFARYAFRDTPQLAAFDPGVFDYAGAAFWMEAHTQNPTTLRRSEDSAVSAPFASLSPAWIVQVMGTLVLATLLFSSVAGEREHGTLRALAAAGVPARDFTTGKVVALGCAAIGIALVVILLAVLPAMLSPDTVISLGRVLLLLIVYTVGLLAFALVIIWVSARAQSLGDAFNGAAMAWLFLAVLGPVLAGQMSVSLYPDIDEQQLKNDIQLKAQTPFWVGEARDPAVAAQEQSVLEEFGGESLEALGFDREALILQAHEVFANQVYDDLYGDLRQRHFDQDAVLRYASLLSPVMALQRLSMGIAGTDLLAQWTYAEQAEQHRRLIIEQLNRDMMIHGGDQGFSYTADRTLWEAIPDFRPRGLSITDIFGHYVVELVSLLAWLLAGGYLAIRATREALRGGS